MKTRSIVIIGGSVLLAAVVLGALSPRTRNAQVELYQSGDVDFLAADAHKWMLGPCGAGILFVKRDLQERLRPIAHGWHNVRCPNFLTQTEIVLKPERCRLKPSQTHVKTFMAAYLAQCAERAC